MNVSGMQVPDEDDRHGRQSRSNTIKANNKIEKERIWINPVTSKIEFKPMDTDIDAQLVTQGACDFSEKSSRICISSSTQQMSQMKCGNPGKLLSV